MHSRKGTTCCHDYQFIIFFSEAEFSCYSPGKSAATKLIPLPTSAGKVFRFAKGLLFVKLYTKSLLSGSSVYRSATLRELSDMQGIVIGLFEAH